VTPPPSSPAARWWPFLAVVAAYLAVTFYNITLPGVYMDAVNPDYMAARILNPKGELVLPWLLPGNWLFQRAPVLVSFYHGSQQMWLGLPFFWLFGTSVQGLRLTHAMFALGVLAAMYAFLNRSGSKPWQSALACAALAVDPSFSYAFRTQSYITLAPAAWLFLSLYSLARGGEGGAHRIRWLVAGGIFYGWAVVAYFIYAFFLPALLLAVRWSPQPARDRAAWIALTAGVAIGAVWYPIGYALTVYYLGGFRQAWQYFQDTQRTLNAFSEQPDLAGRVAHLAANVQSVFHNWYHHSLIFGEFGEVPGARYKTSLLVGGALLLWLRAEWRRNAGALRIVVALALSFCAVALLFGTRLSGHHFMVLMPIAYSALALGLVALAKGPPAWRMAGWTVAVPFAALIGLNIGGQLKEGERLAAVRGVGLYSDAINRLAADLDADPRRPFVYFPDWGLLMPVVFLSNGRVGVDSMEDFAAARRWLCTGRDVAVAFVTGDRSARVSAWQSALRWDAPSIKPYQQADGATVFVLATFRGNGEGPGCAK
jgi:hypothetical protein